MSEGDEGKSEFNMGVATLMRIDRILVRLDDIRIARETEESIGTLQRYWKQNWADLKSLWINLSCFMRSEEEQEHRQAYAECYKLYMEELDKLARTRKISLKFLEEFDDWEIELRTLAKERGLLMKDTKGALESFKSG